MQDNNKKIGTIKKLNKVRSTIEGLRIDDNMKSGIVQSISSVPSSIKEPHETTKFHIKSFKLRDNLEKKKSDVDVACMLISTRNNIVKQVKFVRAKLPSM